LKKVLQPAQGYDIAEKIKQANQKLELESPLSTIRTNRVVRFRTVLEEYEPDYMDGSNSKLSESTEGFSKLNVISPYLFVIMFTFLKDADNNDTIVEEIAEEIQEVVLTETTGSPPCLNTIESDNYVDSDCVGEGVQEFGNEPVETYYSKNQSNDQTLDHKDSNKGKICHTIQRSTPKPSKLKPLKQTKDILCHRLYCKKKFDETQHLPKYNGFYSEYGLSKEQLDRRQKVFEEKIHKRFNRRMKKIEENKTRVNMNESAFKTWLGRKIKNPFNRSKNMFNSKIKPIKVN
jgi:hypothetical protein